MAKWSRFSAHLYVCRMSARLLTFRLFSTHSFTWLFVRTLSPVLVWFGSTSMNSMRLAFDANEIIETTVEDKQTWRSFVHFFYRQKKNVGRYECLMKNVQPPTRQPEWQWMNDNDGHANWKEWVCLCAISRIFSLLVLTFGVGGMSLITSIITMLYCTFQNSE